ncbi:kinase-like domain-containing protein [Aspergillus heterothallicus]
MCSKVYSELLPRMIKTVASTPLLSKRQFPTSGFVKLDISRTVEEESLPFYGAENYYSVSIGQVFASRYQVVSKLGYGTSSTVWLCRDVEKGSFNTLKVCTSGQRPGSEIAVSTLLTNAQEHPGKKMVRTVLDSIKVSGPSGNHTCLVYQPLGMSFTEFQQLLPEKTLPKELAQRTVQLILIALVFLHENGVVHTDISTNNILQGIGDTSILDQIEEEELNRPIARKVLGNRTIYNSRPMPNSTGLPVLSDLGEARMGEGRYRGDIMPDIYRVPEVILDADWDYKVGVWSVGTMSNDEQHLAEMVSLMGPPPQEFLKGSEKCRQFWDEHGVWKGSVLIPEQSFEMRAQRFSGEDKELFVGFLRRVFRWLPEDRPTAEELAYDDFLMQPILAARSTQ